MLHPKIIYEWKLKQKDSLPSVLNNIDVIFFKWMRIPEKFEIFIFFKF